MNRRWTILLLSLGSAMLLAACERQRYFPERAAAPYPREMHRPESVDIQVFREGTDIVIVNATARTYHDFRLWVNQRYVREVEELRAGETRRFSLWDFYDQWGEVMNAGGFFRTYPPDPVRMVEIQEYDESPLIGLLTVRREPLDER